MRPLLFAAALATVGADEYNHRYSAGDKVDLWVNKVRLSRCSLVEFRGAGALSICRDEPDAAVALRAIGAFNWPSIVTDSACTCWL